MAGKLKTTFQCLSISAILLGLAYRPAPSWLMLRDVITWVAVGLTLYSGIAYFVVAAPFFRGKSPLSPP